jgi:glycosyltransferase involved in cell wall biosynthesis
MSRQYLEAGIGKPSQYHRVFSGFDLGPYLQSENSQALRTRYGIRETDFVIGKIARLFKLKGHDDLIHIARDLVESCPNIRFLLVGDGVWRARLESKIESLGLNDHFIFTGLVPPTEIPGLTGIMDMLVHLSIREGLPRALPQALAAGKPVVAYDCDGAKEVCQDNETGFLIDAGDLKTFTRRIRDLWESKTLRDRLAAKGHEFILNNFDTPLMVKNIHAIYSDLLR